MTEQKNIFAKIPAGSDEEIFENLLEKKGVKIERILSYGQKTKPSEWLEQDWEEWVILLKGSAGLRFEGDNTVLILSPGDYIHIPAQKKHRVEYTDKGKISVWLAVHF